MGNYILQQESIVCGMFSISLNTVPMYCWDRQEITVLINGSETSKTFGISVNRSGPADHDFHDMHCATFSVNSKLVISWILYFNCRPNLK